MSIDAKSVEAMPELPSPFAWVFAEANDDLSLRFTTTHSDEDVVLPLYLGKQMKDFALAAKQSNPPKIKASAAAAKRMGADKFGWASFKHRLMEALDIPADRFDSWSVPGEWQLAFKKANGRVSALSPQPPSAAVEPGGVMSTPTEPVRRYLAIYGYETWALPNGILTTKPTIGFDNIRIDYVVGQKPVVSLEEKQ